MTLAQERWKTRLVGMLLIISVLAVAIQSLSTTRILRIDHNPRFGVSAIDDRPNGGRSTSTLIDRNGKLILSCDIVPSEKYPWPYCEISFNLMRTPTQGVDLSGFNRVKLWLSYSGSENSGIRFQTRNYNPRYSKPNDESSLKYNTIEFFKKNASYPIIIPLKSFQVPTWWLTENEISPEFSAPEFDNAFTIELATGNNIKPGHYEIALDKIEFEGKFFSDVTLYLGLLLLWGTAALFYIFSQVRLIRSELKAANLRQRELESLNRLLHVKSQKLEEQLTRDPLTGVLNRDGIGYLFEHSELGQRPLQLAMIFIDIDYFKQVNDTHGHLIGDKVLIQFAQILEQNTRDTDVLARWGGEEFVIVCPNTDLMNTARLAEKLRLCIAASKWPEGVSLTASFGVAEMLNESPSDFITRADKALYTAKARGRNRVIIALAESEGEIALS